MRISARILLRMARVALTPRRTLLKATLVNGTVVYGQNRPGFGGRGVYIYRDALEPELLVLERLLPAAGVLVDVGANTGVYTLKAARHFRGRGTVLAIEPFPAVLATLRRSVEANGLTNVRLRELAVSDHGGSAVLWRNFGKPNSFSLVRRDPRATSFAVQVVTLDELCRAEGLERLDYLKIDVEGAEAAVLAGAREIIARYRPILQVEASIAVPPLSQWGDYAVLHAPASPNRVGVPREHPALAIALDLGWTEQDT